MYVINRVIQIVIERLVWEKWSQLIL